MNFNGVINCAKEISIDNHVWIGINAIILKSVNIKNNVVIGAGL